MATGSLNWKPWPFWGFFDSLLLASDTHPGPEPAIRHPKRIKERMVKIRAAGREGELGMSLLPGGAGIEHPRTFSPCEGSIGRSRGSFSEHEEIRISLCFRARLFWYSFLAKPQLLLDPTTLSPNQTNTAGAFLERRFPDVLAARRTFSAPATTGRPDGRRAPRFCCAPCPSPPCSPRRWP